MSVKVKFIAETKLKKGKDLLKAAQDLKMPIKESCGGKGKCGKCIVKIKSGKVTPPTKEELKELGDDKISKGYRLACQVEADGGDEDITVIIE